MSETSESKAEASAEKAYAAAAEAVPVAKKEPEATAAADSEPVQSGEVLSVPAIADKQKAKAAKSAAPAKRAPAKKARRTKAVRKPAATASKPKARKAPAKASKPAAKTVAAKKSGSNSTTNPKDKTMTKTAKTKTKTDIKKVVADAQAKAKKAAAKGGEFLGEARDFSKGNVDAVVESGKIFANGVQAIGKEMAADTKSTFELVAGEFKDLAAVKSPAEFFKLQGEFARKNLDTAISLTEKNAETLGKLASESFAPISGRFSLAAAKVRKIAA